MTEPVKHVQIAGRFERQTDRPVWDFKYPEEEARWLLSRRIAAIKARTSMSDNFETESWLEMYDSNGETRRFDSFPEYVQFRPVFGNLVGSTYESDRMKVRIAEIDTWEMTHAKERAEYERLKRKFGE